MSDKLINKNVGLLLISIGFFAGSLIAVMDATVINWGLFAAALVAGVAGVAIAQIAIHRAATDTSTLTANFSVLDQHLKTLAERAAEFDEKKTTFDPYDLPGHIDKTFPDSLNAFADARESIRHAHGADAYASVMTHFAAGERYLNRVWSCSSDGYIDEAQIYIGRAKEQFAEALKQFEALGP